MGRRVQLQLLRAIVLEVTNKTRDGLCCSFCDVVSIFSHAQFRDFL